MAGMSKDDFLKWLKPVIQEMIEKHCKEYVDKYIKDSIAKLVFEKAAERVMNITTQTDQEQPVTYQVAEQYQSRPQVQTYETFDKFVKNNNHSAPAVQQPQRIQESTINKNMTVRAKTFAEIVDNIDPIEVAKHRVQN